MIKSIFAMQEHPDLPIAECQQHWYEIHGAAVVIGRDRNMLP